MLNAHTYSETHPKLIRQPLCSQKAKFMFLYNTCWTPHTSCFAFIFSCSLALKYSQHSPQRIKNYLEFSLTFYRHTYSSRAYKFLCAISPMGYEEKSTNCDTTVPSISADDSKKTGRIKGNSTCSWTEIIQLFGFHHIHVCVSLVWLDMCLSFSLCCLYSLFMWMHWEFAFLWSQ